MTPSSACRQSRRPSTKPRTATRTPSAGTRCRSRVAVGSDPVDGVPTRVVVRELLIRRARRCDGPHERHVPRAGRGKEVPDVLVRRDVAGCPGRPQAGCRGRDTCQVGVGEPAQEDRHVRTRQGLCFGRHSGIVDSGGDIGVAVAAVPCDHRDRACGGNALEPRGVGGLVPVLERRQDGGRVVRQLVEIPVTSRVRPPRLPSHPSGRSHSMRCRTDRRMLRRTPLPPPGRRVRSPSTPAPAIAPRPSFRRPPATTAGSRWQPRRRMSRPSSVVAVRPKPTTACASTADVVASARSTTGSRPPRAPPSPCFEGLSQCSSTAGASRIEANEMRLRPASARPGGRYTADHGTDLTHGELPDRHGGHREGSPGGHRYDFSHY